MTKLIPLVVNKNIHATLQTDGSLYIVQESNDVRDTQQIVNLTAGEVQQMLIVLKLNGIEGVTL